MARGCKTMSFIYNYLLRVFKKKSRCVCHEQPFSSSSAQLETSHYQHVVLLKNSINGAQIYLIGTSHVSKQSAETVKKVIDYVMPDVVAIEQCKKRAMGLMNWKPEDATFYKLLCKSMRAPGGLCTKFATFFMTFQYNRVRADGIIPCLEFKVAMEESSRVGARCFYMDQDINVTLQQLSKVSSFYWLGFIIHDKDKVEFTRSSVQEIQSSSKKLRPDIFKVMVEDRDKFMFTNLRSFQGKVVAVVGMGHMDGIELLWRRVEEDDNSSVFITVIEDCHVGFQSQKFASGRIKTMASCIYNYLLRVFKKKSRCVCHEQPSSSSAQDETHYQHGIPGIPTDGKVVLLTNSINGTQIYLIGTNHVSKQSAETVKKVIDYVRPDVVAVEQCKKSAMGIMNWTPENATFYKLFRKSMRAPGGLCRKFGTHFMDCQYRRMLADGIFPGLEFKVAIEESSRVGARCFYIDQDIDDMLQQFSKVSSFYWLWFTYDRVRNEVEVTRSSVQEMQSSLKKLRPEIFKVIVEDRDKFMFTNLRSFQGKVVAVVGMGHMDGIELLWRRAEEDDNSSVFITVTEGCHGHSE
ncbi:hypothetical protein MKW92_026291 [Papaver armeniacum]|nr:hypothetical protein MKW92_026291 [Papaver armeniacum]